MHIPARRFMQGPKAFRRILSAVAILLTAGCPYCDNRVDRVDIIPGSVAAVPDKQFMMGVRLTNKVGHLMADEKAEQVRWKSSDAAHLTVPDIGAHPLITLHGSPAGPITLTASLDGKSGTATISLAKPGLTPIMDWATTRHFDKQPPTLVLVDGKAPSEWRSDSVIAFVGAAPLDQFLHSDAPGEVTVFSPGHALQRLNLEWSEDQCDHVRMTENGASYPGEVAVPLCTPTQLKLLPATSIPIHIWSVVARPDAVSSIEVHLSEARRKLVNGWTGVTLDLEAPIEVKALDLALIIDLSAPPGEQCMGTHKMSDQLDAANVSYGPRKVTVVYAKAIQEPSGGVFVSADVGGFSCPRDPTLGTVIVMSWEKAVESTLGHELGHAIGPPLFHTNGTTGISDSNLMWSYDALVPGSRKILTLGQAFRLALDGKSFIYDPPHATPDCEGAEAQCPFLSKDAIKK